LHYACFYRYIDIALLLLEAGAILNGLNKYKKSPLNYAGTKLSAELKGL
jgi:ankyrin repeat protein